MLIKRICPFTGVLNEMEIAVTEQQLAYWKAGALIQDVMPSLTADEREFIKTGITADVWEKTFREA